MIIVFVKSIAIADCEIVNEAKELCEQSSSFQEIIGSWITEHRTAEFHPGVDAEGKPSVILVLNDGSVEIGECQAEVDEVKKCFPLALSFSDPNMPWNKKGLSPSDQSALLDPWFKERDVRLKVTYDEDIYHNVATLNATTDMAMCYALSNYGNVHLSLIDKEESEDFDGDPAKREGYISFGFEFMDADTHIGWSEHCYGKPN